MFSNLTTLYLLRHFFSIVTRVSPTWTTIYKKIIFYRGLLYFIFKTDFALEICNEHIDLSKTRNTAVDEDSL